MIYTILGIFCKFFWIEKGPIFSPKSGLGNLYATFLNQKKECLTYLAILCVFLQVKKKSYKNFNWC